MRTDQLKKNVRRKMVLNIPEKELNELLSHYGELVDLNNIKDDQIDFLAGTLDRCKCNRMKLSEIKSHLDKFFYFRNHL